MNKMTITGKMDAPLEPLLPMTEEEVLAAALSDPDAQPWTEEQLKNRKRLPQARRIRFRLMLTQQQFAERYRIPLGTLRDWEQGAAEPDSCARAYLKVISLQPDMVAEALAAEPKRPDAA